MKITSARHRQRQRNLNLLVAEVGGATALQVLTGTPKTHISAMQSGARGMGDQLAEKLEKKTGKPSGWMDDPSAEQGGVKKSHAPQVAQPMSLRMFTVPHILQWGELMTLGELPEWFTLEIPDQALFPVIPKGTKIIFECGSDAAPGNKVLVTDRDHSWHIRIFQQIDNDRWVAKAINTSAFADLGNEQYGLQVRAIARYVQDL